jgi:hypothetical protein
MGWTDKLAEFLRLNDGEQAYTGYPQMQVGLNKPRQSGYATGFLEGASGMDSMQPKNPITDPNYEQYAQGKNTGEAVNIGAMALPGYAMALRAGAPKVADMIGNYMVKTGGIQPMFMGPESKMWNNASAFEASKLEKANKTPQEIWQSTGTTRGLDNALRQELSDENAFLKGGGNFQNIVEKRMDALGVTTPTVEEIMHHPQLFEAYPQLKGIQVQYLPKDSKNNASYSPKEGIIRVNRELDNKQATSSMLHELQHAIQETEGWNKGADAGYIMKNYQSQLNEIEDRLKEANKAASKAVGTEDYDRLMGIRDAIGKEYRNIVGTDIRGIYGKAIDEYKAHGGEAEARLTQARQKLTPEERKNIYPFAKGNKALDINPEDAIIKMEHDSPTITRKQLLQQLLETKK